MPFFPLATMSELVCRYQGVKLTVNLHLVPTLRMRGAVPPLLLSYASLSVRDNFTFYLSTVRYQLSSLFLLTAVVLCDYFL
jgi:hypothetical protein